MHYRAFERTKGRSFPNLLINKLIWPVDPVQVKLPRKNRTLDNGNYHEWLHVEKRIMKQWRARMYANINRLCLYDEWLTWLLKRTVRAVQAA